MGALRLCRGCSARQIVVGITALLYVRICKDNLCAVTACKISPAHSSVSEMRLKPLQSMCISPFKVHVETYLRVSSLLWAVLLAMWLTIFALLSQFKFTRGILQKYPDLCSFNMFKVKVQPMRRAKLGFTCCFQKSGPSQQQIAEASFIYWFFGYGYSDHKPMGEQHEGKPDQKVSC